MAEKCGEAARAADANGERQAAAAGTEAENALQSLCWGSLAVGSCVGSVVGMLAASSTPAHAIFGLAALCPLLVLLASRALHDSRPTSDGGGKRALVSQQLVALCEALCTPSIWRPLLFFLLQNALVPGCSQAMLFFMTDVLNFSPEFLAAQNLVASLFLLIGTLVYSRYVQGTSFVRIFAYGQLAAPGCCLLDVLLASRYTLLLGVPDHLFVIGTDAVGVVLNRLMMQPFLVIAARLCPVGCEAALCTRALNRPQRRGLVRPLS